MRKRKIIILITTFFLSIVFLFTFTTNTLAASIDMSNKISNEVTYLVDDGTLPSWHMYYKDDEGYQAYYYKMRYLNKNFDLFKSETITDIRRHLSWYQSEKTETWDYILNNLDIEPEYLEPDKYVGIYWDSYAYDSLDTGYLYLIWTSRYLPSEFITITEYKESGKTYKLYDTEEDIKNFNMNWIDSTYYHFKDEDLTIHITPIAGFNSGKSFGQTLKSKYTFEGLKYGMDEGQYESDMDPSNIWSGFINYSITFDLHKTPKNDGNNAMQLTTHAYEYIKDCEVQSYYDLAFGGYKHMVHFNMTIDPDEIYRVDTKYTISNDNKKWYQFWKPNDSHTILKSLTKEKVNGGFLSLFNYQGFKEGSFSSVSNPNKKFKYELLLDYDDQGWLWKIFTGELYKESDYQLVNEFQILRINYLLDDEVYDVAIKMDTLEGSTHTILDSDLIENEDSLLHDVKTIFEKIKDKFKSLGNKAKWALIIIASIVGLGLILIIILKFKNLFTRLFKKEECSCKKKE